MRKHGGEKFVIKPTDRSGARGVLLVHASSSDLDLMYEEAKAKPTVARFK